MGLFDYWSVLGRRTAENVTPSPATSTGQRYVTAPTAPPRRVGAPPPSAPRVRSLGGGPAAPPLQEPGRTVRYLPWEPEEMQEGRSFFQRTPVLSQAYMAGRAFAEFSGINVTLPSILTKEETITRSLPPITRSFTRQIGDITQTITETETSTEIEKRLSTVAPENPTPSMWSYPLYELGHGAGETWRKNLADPYAEFIKPRLKGRLGFEQLGSAAIGFMNVPTLGSEFLGMLVPGGERLFREAMRSPSIVPGYAAAGLTMMGTQLVRGFREDPFKQTAELVGMYAFLEGALAVPRYLTGVARSLGKTPIDIETIGYGPEAGYPWGFEQTPKTLRKSFRMGTLIPKPSLMRSGITEEVPYVPEMARLPGQAVPSNFMYTVWEGSPRPWQRSFNVGPGASGLKSIRGMYGSPIAETYFGKVGGQMPETFGFDISPFKTPSIFQTEVKGFEAIPDWARSGSTEALKYANMNRYLAEHGEPGTAYMPFMKPEYEAVIFKGTRISDLTSKYYTKVGGINILGKNVLGTRIPIYEAKAGPGTVTIPDVISKATGFKSEYYRAPPRINIPTFSASVSASVTSRIGIQSPSMSGSSLGGYGRSSVPKLGKTISSTAGSSGAYPVSKISSSALKSVSSPKISSRISGGSSLPSRSYGKSIISGISRGYSGVSGFSGKSGISVGYSGKSGFSGVSGKVGKGSSITSKTITYKPPKPSSFLWPSGKKKQPWNVRASVKSMEWKITNPVPTLKGFKFKMPKGKR